MDHNEEKQMHPKLLKRKGKITGLIDHHVLLYSCVAIKGVDLFISSQEYLLVDPRLLFSDAVVVINDCAFR